jgi:hypothetical protein
VSRKFPERIIVDFGDADAEGFPKISEAIAFEMPCDTVEVALSDEEACKYVREDIVDHLQAERDSLRRIATRISSIHPSHINALENGPLKITLHAIQRDAKEALRGDKQ